MKIKVLDLTLVLLLIVSFILFGILGGQIRSLKKDNVLLHEKLVYVLEAETSNYRDFLRFLQFYANKNDLNIHFPPKGGAVYAESANHAGIEISELKIDN